MLGTFKIRYLFSLMYDNIIIFFFFLLLEDKNIILCLDLLQLTKWIKGFLNLLFDRNHLFVLNKYYLEKINI